MLEVLELTPVTGCVCTEWAGAGAGGWGWGWGLGLGLVIVNESGQFHSTHRLRPWCRRGAEADGPQPIMMLIGTCVILAHRTVVASAKGIA